ncbi:MAG TPA: bifunctional diguanylate cyclase/phosphodiesterase [Acidimicrobiales bacterium]|nr:bifunctional diguanylate cyclase/phosphodiesterase [Acidimicrobiales bacterium]
MWFYLCITLPGLALLVRIAQSVQLTDVPEALSSPVLWAFAIFLFPSELWPVQVPLSEGTEEMKTSSAFGYAILLTSGARAAIGAMVVAALLAGLVRRKGVWRTAFDMAVYTGGVCAAAVVFARGAGIPLANLDSAVNVAVNVKTLAPILAGAGVLFVIVHVASAVASAMWKGLSPAAHLTRDFSFQASTAGVLMALSPMAVVAANQSLIVVPLMGLPLYSVYKSARSSLGRERDALHDTLTGLPNRTLFRDRVDQGTAASRRNGGTLAVMLIDLDGFKEVNDTLGHHMGDVLLQQVAIRLERFLRGCDTVSRLGGDEFAVYLPDIPNIEAARESARRLLTALQEPFHLEGISLGVQASVGIAGFPEHGLDTETLLQRADTAMYEAKRLKTGVEVYLQGRDRASRRKLALTGELRGAVEANQLLLHYQPKARLSDGAVVSVEALVRWNHPWYGMVAPTEFIPLAERTGVMRPLTINVLDQALRQIREWSRLQLELSVAVNISTQNFHDLLLPDEIAQLLARHGVPARLLEIEITESMLIADPLRAMDIMGRLSDMGIRLVIDDFGTGYSSLAYLKRLPVNGLKIDKSFVQHLTTDENDAVIVRSTIDLARNLGLDVVAEGVETKEAWDALHKLGCHLAQGYYLSPPLAADEFLQWWRSWTSRGERLAPGQQAVLGQPQPTQQLTQLAQPQHIAHLQQAAAPQGMVPQAPHAAVEQPLPQ